MVELSARDFEQRIRVVACRPDERGLPVIAEEGDVSTRRPEAAKMHE